MGNNFEFNKNLLTSQKERIEMKGNISSLLTCKDSRMILNAHCTCGKGFSYDLLNNKDKNVQKKFILLVSKVDNSYLLETCPILYCKKCGAINVFRSFIKTIKIVECDTKLEVKLIKEEDRNGSDFYVNIDTIGHMLMACPNYIKLVTDSNNWYIFDTAKECVDFITNKIKDVEGKFLYGTKMAKRACMQEKRSTKRKCLNELESLIEFDDDNYFISKLFVYKQKCIMTNSLYHDALIVYDDTHEGKISVTNLFTVFNLFNGKSKCIKESIVFNLNSGMTYLSIRNGNKSLVKNITYQHAFDLLNLESKDFSKYVVDKGREISDISSYRSKNEVFRELTTLTSSYKADLNADANDFEILDPLIKSLDSLKAEIKEKIYNLIKKYKEEHFNIKFYKDANKKDLRLSLFNRFGDAYLDYQKYINAISFMEEACIEEMVLDKNIMEATYSSRLIKKLKHNIPNTHKNLKDELYFKFKPNISQDEFITSLICNNLVPDRNLIQGYGNIHEIECVCFAYVLLKQLLKVKTLKDEKILFKRIFNCLNIRTDKYSNDNNKFDLDFGRKNLLMDSIKMYMDNKKYIKKNHKNFNFDLKDINYTHNALISIQIEYDIINSKKVEKYCYKNKIKEAFNKKIGNIEFKLAENNLDLVRAGRIMNICVGSYTEKVKRGKCSIVVGYDTTHKFKNPVFCMEVNENFDELIQFKGDRNSIITMGKGGYEDKYSHFIKPFSYNSERYTIEAIKYIAHISKYVIMENYDTYDLMRVYCPEKDRYRASLKINDEYIDITSLCKEIINNQQKLEEYFEEQKKREEVHECDIEARECDIEEIEEIGEDMRLYA